MMRHYKLILAFFFFCIALISCKNPVSPGKKSNQGKTYSRELIIFHAGSLSVPFKKIAQAFETENPGIKVTLEAAGSVTCARKITDLHKPCDIIGSADYKVIDELLIPDYTQQNLHFASNEMVIAYLPASRYAHEITSENWHEILAKEKVEYGRSDPDSDPCGYRSILCMKLAGMYYHDERIMDYLLDKSRRFIRPKAVDLIGLLESGAIDYIFTYRSVATQHKLLYVSLPKEINLGDSTFGDLYKTVSVDIRGKKPGQFISIRGEQIVYSVAVLTEAPHPDVAEKFIAFLFSPDKGLRIMAKCGQGIIKENQDTTLR